MCGRNMSMINHLKKITIWQASKIRSFSGFRLETLQPLHAGTCTRCKWADKGRGKDADRVVEDLTGRRGRRCQRGGSNQWQVSLHTHSLINWIQEKKSLHDTSPIISSCEPHTQELGRFPMYPDPSDSMHIIDAQRFIEAWIQRQDKNGKVEGRQVEKWRCWGSPKFRGLGKHAPFFVFCQLDVCRKKTGQDSLGMFGIFPWQNEFEQWKDDKPIISPFEMTGTITVFYTAQVSVVRCQVMSVFSCQKKGEPWWKIWPVKTPNAALWRMQKRRLSVDFEDRGFRWRMMLAWIIMNS